MVGFSHCRNYSRVSLFPCGWWTCTIILFDYFYLSLINQICHQLILYYLILIIIYYYSSTLFVLFDHPYCLLRFISVCFYLFVLIFYHIFNFGWLMQMPYIISVLLFITHQHLFLLFDHHYYYTDHLSLFLFYFFPHIFHFWWLILNAIYHSSLRGRH